MKDAVPPKGLLSDEMWKLSMARRSLYAGGAHALRSDLETAGADGIFDQALTTGLLAVVADVIDGHPAGKPTKKNLPPASALLATLVETFGKDDEGLVPVPTGRPESELGKGGLMVWSDQERMLRVDVNLLADALKRTQAARHGRGPSGLLTEVDVDALLALDDHPALGVVGDYDRDQQWVFGGLADEAEHARAYELLLMLTDDDIAARVAAVEFSHGGHDDPELQECPVCENETLVATGPDGWGYGILAGTCPVCSYTRSEHVAEEMGLTLELQRQWDKAD